MPTDYQNILTDLVKRIRPLMAQVIKASPNVAHPQWEAVNASYNLTTAAQFSPQMNSAGYYEGIPFPSGATNHHIVCGASFITPVGWTGTISVYPVARFSSWSNNIYARNIIFYRRYLDGSGATTGAGDSGWLAVAPADTGSLLDEFPDLVASCAITSRAHIDLAFARDMTNGSDTYTSTFNFKGWMIVYS